MENTNKPIEGITTGILKVSGAELYYETKGEGPLLLMIPGANGDHFIFTPIREIFNIKIIGGIEKGRISLSNSLTSHFDALLNTFTALRVGVETEIYLPFNKNKISLLFEPNYQYLNTFVQTSYYEKVIIKYNSIDFPIGIRYHQNFKNQSLFFDVHVTPNIQLNFGSDINYYNKVQIYNQIPNTTYPILITTYFSTGIGYQYKNAGIEFRWNFKRNLMNTYVTFTNYYENLSLLFSYKILQKNSRH
jgi:hypothetical protein